MKKRIIFVLTAAMLFFSQVIFSSCGDDEEDEPVQNNSDGNVKTESKYTVSYSSDFGVAPQSLTVKEGDKLTSGDLKPLDTDGYIFLGWYNGSNQVEEGFVVKQDLKLVAKWTKDEHQNTPKEGEDETNPNAGDYIDNTQIDEEYQNTPKKGEDETCPNAGDYIDNVQTDVDNN